MLKLYLVYAPNMSEILVAATTPSKAKNINPMGVDWLLCSSQRTLKEWMMGGQWGSSPSVMRAKLIGIAATGIEAGIVSMTQRPAS